MSNFHRVFGRALTLAAALALAVPVASAVTLDNGSTTNPLPMKVPNTSFNGVSGPGVALDQLRINISGSDLIIGRTTGFSVRIDLPSNVTFASLPAPTIGAALPCSGASCWTATLAAGGTSADSYAVYSVQPGANSLGVTNGVALTFATGSVTGGSYPNYTFSGLAIMGTPMGKLATLGSSVSATVTFADPNTAQQILTPVSQSLVISANGLAYSMAASSQPLTKIDVGSSAAGGSKTEFASSGALNSANQYYFEAGTPTMGATPGLQDVNNVPYVWQNTDELNLTVSGSFAAFTQTGASVGLVTAGTCAAPTTTIAGTVTASSVTFTGVKYSSLNAGKGILCFRVPAANTQVIDPTNITTSATATRVLSGTSSTPGTGDGLAMAYNGPVATVYTFNPAGNTTQQSFLRISNTGGTGGLVTITAKDDTGAAGTGSVSFTLAAGKSIQLTSTDLENGNAAKGLTGALGAGSGKRILTVTGQISGMEVTNLNRNNSSGTVSNLATPAPKKIT